VVGEVNAAPTLTAIDPLSVVVGGLLTFNINGEDADLPAQSLSYSLTGEVPKGASVNEDAGGFSWDVSDSQAADNYIITVEVSDSGSPTMTASLSFSVTVTEEVALAITGIVRHGDGSFTIHWNSVPGKTYRLLHKNSLQSTEWTTSGEIVAPEATTSLKDTPDAGVKIRFYGVIQLE
jgi:hypothetical protein